MRAHDFGGAAADLFELAFERLGDVGAALRVTFAAAETGTVDAALALEIDRRTPRARCAWCAERRPLQLVDEISDRRRGNLDLPILRAVAIRHGVTIAELRSGSRSKWICAARFEAYWLLHQAGRSTPDIGRALGGRDHSTVIYGLGRFKAKLAADPGLAARLTGGEIALRVEAAS